MPISESEIVIKCQKWDLDQFSLLYDTYVDGIYRFIYLKVFQKEVAEDLTSDVFFKALSKINTYNPEKGASFKTWIYKIAYNTIVDYFRVNKEKVDIDEIVETIQVDEDIAENIDNKDKIKKILSFLETVDPKVKRIIILRFWDDLSFKEIAEITGESVDNCKKIVSRTIAKIDINTLIILLIFMHF